MTSSIASFNLYGVSVDQMLLAIAILAVLVASFLGLRVYTRDGDASVATADPRGLSPITTLVVDVPVLASKNDIASAVRYVSDYKSGRGRGQTLPPPFSQTYSGQHRRCVRCGS